MATRRRPPPLPRTGPVDDRAFKAVELVQRGRMILDVATADLEVAEARLGPFHPTSWYFRNAKAEAQLAWDRLRAVYGGAALDAALEEPPATTLTLENGDDRSVVLVPIRGRTYRAERLGGTPMARCLWRLTRLGGGEGGPYYVGRLADDSLQCDCAEWAYHPDETPATCKHLEALAALDWLT